LIFHRCSYPNLKYLNLVSTSYGAGDIDLKNIGVFPLLETLVLNARNNIVDLEKIMGLSLLKSLTLGGRFNRNVDFLKDMTSLKTLKIESPNFTKDICELPRNLKRFIWNCDRSHDLDKVSFYIKATLPVTLKEISFFNCAYMGELIGLDRCDNLRSFSNDNDSIMDIPKLPTSIENLECNYITDTTFPRPSMYQNLRSLSIEQYSNDDIRDIINNFKNLKNLCLNANFPVTYALGLKNLRSLSLGTYFNQDLNFLKFLNTLTTLSIRSINFNRDTSPIKYLVNLTILRYSGNILTFFKYLSTSCVDITLDNYNYYNVVDLTDIYEFMDRLDPSKSYRISVSRALNNHTNILQCEKPPNLIISLLDYLNT
jgi:hypothetical protein